MTIQLIIKDLTFPLRLILTTVLKRRLRINHCKHPEIERDLARRWAGYWGEIALANYVKELPQEKYYIFHDLQLQYNGVHFQIDTLLICQTYILIIEAKNINGTLLFDNVFKQLIRINENGTEESFEDPRVQCQRLQSLLGGWLRQNGFNLLPMDYLIFFKGVKTILKANPGEKVDFSKICKGRDIFNKIDSLEHRYNQVRVDNETLKRLVELLLSQHTPKQINILEEYNILQVDIRSGVHCPNCFLIPMIYKKGKWNCPSCETSSKDALIESLYDYFYLIKPHISSSEFRRFFHISTKDIAQKILVSLDLPSTGTTKNRLYHFTQKEISYAFYLKKQAAYTSKIFT